MAKPLTLGVYQALAARTDRTRKGEPGLDLPLLGLFGEIGSLLSEVKKKQRDERSYIGYEGSVVEEMGDVLWYLAVIADRSQLSLPNIASNLNSATSVVDDIPFTQLQPQHSLPLNSPSTAFERNLMRLASHAGTMVGKYGGAAAESPEGG